MPSTFTATTVGDGSRTDYRIPLYVTVTAVTVGGSPAGYTQPREEIVRLDSAAAADAAVAITYTTELPVFGTPVPDYEGAAPVLQPSWANVRVRQWYTTGTSGTLAIGTATPAVANQGGASPRNAAGTGVVAQWSTRSEKVSATAGTFTSIAQNVVQFMRGGVPNAGGFLLTFEFAINNATNPIRLFCGMHPNTGADTSGIQPSTLTDIIGFGVDSGDTNLQVFTNDAAGTASKVDLGSAFAIQSTTNVAFLVSVYCAPNSSEILWSARATTNAGAVTTQTGTLSADLPTATTLLAPVFEMAATTASSNNAFMLNRMHLETPGP